jgi:type I restriction enzyme M protein
MENFNDKVSFIWSIAELLRGPYKPEDYGHVVLPMAVLRRFDCALECTKTDVLDQYEQVKELPEEIRDEILNRVAGQQFNNTSKYDFQRLQSDADNIADNLRDYINGFSKSARDIIEYFDFEKQIDKMERNNMLYLVVQRFSQIDLHPNQVSNREMGYIFEELIRRFSEHAEAGDHYTPREVIRLMVALLFMDDEDILTKPGITQTLYDSCAGTGGMGSVAQDYLKELNPKADLEFFAQEFNEESYAICQADMLIKGENIKNIQFGDTLSQDAFPAMQFDYLITNPPYGVDWKKEKDAVQAEFDEKGFNGRFGSGLPRVSDGQLLFLQNLVAKMKPVTDENKKGSRVAIIMNGSPLFTGDAGSGESEIRRYLFENDLVEGIVALPNDMFYNTGISTYIWILTNHKSVFRKGKVELVNAIDFYQKMKKSLGNKRNELSETNINEIVRLYGDFKEGENVKIFDNEDFGFRKITVERPFRLNFKVDAERIERLKIERAFEGLAKSRKKGTAGIQEIEEGKKQQTQIINVLQDMQSDNVYKNRTEFEKKLKNEFKKCDVSIPPSLLKTMINALSEKDETAEICKDRKGHPEADPDLRDTENVPLNEDIHEYFEREVLPHVPDAWIDEPKTKIGYEIPFTRHFYKYKKLRSSQEIMEDIKKLEVSIAEQLKKVTY